MNMAERYLSTERYWFKVGIAEGIKHDFSKECVLDTMEKFRIASLKMVQEAEHSLRIVYRGKHMFNFTEEFVEVLQKANAADMDMYVFVTSDVYEARYAHPFTAKLIEYGVPITQEPPGLFSDSNIIVTDSKRYIITNSRNALFNANNADFAASITESLP